MLMEKEIRILLIEDVPEDIRFAQIQFKQIFGNKHTVDVADYFSKAVQLLQIKPFDIILLDLSLPDSKGLNSFKNIHRSYNIPVIIYTGLDNELVKMEALKYGAMDYLIKGKTAIDTLKASIVNSIIRKTV
jgi:two-component system cell cycle sensor histidine kinase/response regulator CckA